MKRHDFLPIFVELTRQYPELIFWKHFDRGILGEGDIDTIAPMNLVNQISSSFVSKTLEYLPDSVAVVECHYSIHVRPHFVVLKPEFPNLFQFDISWNPMRMGLPWCDPLSLAYFSFINAMGIRVLRPGALSVVLVMLYGISWKGNNYMKTHDHNDVLAGIRAEPDVAHQFINTMIQNNLNKSLHDLVIHLKTNEWSASIVKQIWRGIVFNALRYHLANPKHFMKIFIKNPTFFMAHGKRKHDHDRGASQPSIQQFLNDMSIHHHVINSKPEMILPKVSQ